MSLCISVCSLANAAILRKAATFEERKKPKKGACFFFWNNLVLYRVIVASGRHQVAMEHMKRIVAAYLRHAFPTYVGDYRTCCFFSELHVGVALF